MLTGGYFYNCEGKRVKKHRYVGGVLAEVTVFVYSAGKLIAEYSTAAPEASPTTKWTVTDQLGSPRVLVNSLGEVVSRRDFMPFGEAITPDGTHRTTNLKYNFGDNVRQNSPVTKRTKRPSSTSPKPGCTKTFTPASPPSIRSSPPANPPTRRPLTATSM